MKIKHKNQEHPKVSSSPYNVTVKVFDENVVETINNISKALLNLTEMLSATKVEVTGIKILNQKDVKIGEKET